MNKKQFDKQKLIDFWIVGADDDYDTMIAMFDTKRYSWALFVGHLMIEKLLKAYFVKINENYPPFTHNLLKLAKDTNLPLTDELKLQLTTITAFNLNTRYDDYKRSFQKKCTPDFTNEWIEKIKELKLWIREQIK
ncbi:MAG: HEPN domain-containing protein [Candidatus Marinimicrobia bacterium]|nr:HEPN domain-containing protein [bacterium]MCG2716974.1 HEPN domain-containing protein [Candidatus Neomarinimicrobiota bacterium]